MIDPSVQMAHRHGGELNLPRTAHDFHNDHLPLYVALGVAGAFVVGYGARLLHSEDGGTSSWWWSQLGLYFWGFCIIGQVAGIWSQFYLMGVDPQNSGTYGGVIGGICGSMGGTVWALMHAKRVINAAEANTCKQQDVMDPGLAAAPAVPLPQN